MENICNKNCYEKLRMICDVDKKILNLLVKDEDWNVRMMIAKIRIRLKKYWIIISR